MEINCSIIIPHKNIPALLQRCLDSIPERDDVQIIIVDDNSDPNKVDFVNFPGLNRKNTEVLFTKEDKGAGYARNVGLLRAKGRWLLFADSDDFFTPNLGNILNAYKDDESDMIFFKVIGIDSDSLQPHHRGDTTNQKLNKIQKTNNWEGIRPHCPPWGKLIKRSLIENNQIQFQEVRYSNDVFFSWRSYFAASKKRIANEELYYITFREDSLVALSLESSRIRMDVALYVYAYFKKEKRKFNTGAGYIWMEIYGQNKRLAISLLPVTLRKYNIYYFSREALAYFRDVYFRGKKGRSRVM